MDRSVRSAHAIDAKRLNFTNASVERIKDGATRLGRCLHRVMDADLIATP
jgi:hypothetical protein